jgi:UrcA family protein
MSFMDHHRTAATQWIGARLKPAFGLLGALTLCALSLAAFSFPNRQGSTPPSTRSARVSLAGLDLSTPEGARGARERIRQAARDLCSRNPGQRSLDWCVDEVVAAAQRQIQARTVKVSLADLDLGTPQGVHAARDRLHAAARLVCQGLQDGSNAALTQYSACVDETLAHALRQTDSQTLSGPF